MGIFRIVVVNETNNSITLPSATSLGRITFQKNQQINQVSEAKTESSKNLDAFRRIIPGIGEELRDELCTLLIEHQYSFAFETSDLGHTELVKHTIDTQGQGPIRQRAYRFSPHQRETAQEIIDELLRFKIIQPSLSPWAAPIVLVKKKTGDVRLCVDYRKLNAITKKDSFPLPRIDDVLDMLDGQKFFSTIDLASGYWQIEMDDDSKEKTAFIVDNNVYEWNRLAFGLTNAPGTFQRLMNFVLRGVLGKTCLVYLDDIIVFSKTKEEHFNNLRQIFRLLDEANLKMKLAKCEFLCKSVHYLGHIISGDGVAPDPAKVETLKNFSRPRTVVELQSFLGLASYYRRFIKDFSTIAHPLLQHTQGKPKPKDLIPWGEDEIKAFECLRSILITEPLLAFPDFSKELLVHTDASNYGAGAVLSQMHGGKDKPIAYASRHFNKAELNYSTIEKEAAAVVFGIKRFRHYLQDKPFVIVSDHRPLQWLKTFKDETGRLGRWSIMLANTNYTVKYRPGRIHENADFLSRIPVCSVRASPTNVVMIKEQEKDLLCNDIRAYMTKGELREENRNPYPSWAKEIELYFTRDGVLCREGPPISSKRRRSPQTQVVVPLNIRKQLLEEYHDSPLSGHLATRRTRLRLEDKYYWPSLDDDVKTYCKSCTVCALQRRSTLRAYLNPLELATRPFEILGLDFMGPILPHSPLGNNHILVITDYFTKWVEVIPLRTTSALVTAKALMDRVILYHGPPKTVVTDRGPNFTSELFSSLCKALNVKHLRTTAYHPQTNGLTERFNRTMVEMIRKYLEKGFSRWEDALGPVAFAYRNSVHSSTNETPYFLNHGRDPVLPIDQFLQVPNRTSTVPSDYKSQLLQRIHEAFVLAQQNLYQARAQQKEQYDKRVNEQLYEVGDKVLLSMKTPILGTSKKLIPRFIGPYRVTKVHSNKTVEIRENPGKQTQLVHINRLKPLCESMIWGDLPSIPFVDVVNELPITVLLVSSPLPIIPEEPLPPATDEDLMNFDDLVVPPRPPTPPCSPTLVAPHNSPVDPSTPSPDTRPPRRAGLRPWNLLKQVNP